MFHEIVKSATTEDHKNAEKHSYGAEIMSRTLNKQQYSQLLVANYMYIAAWEAQWSELMDYNSDNLHLDSRRKMELLEQDFAELGINKDDLPSLELPMPATKAQFLGRMYVIEGSTLGGAMISKQLMANSNLAGLDFRFYGGYGPMLIPFWKQFLEELNAVTYEEDQAECIAWAKQSFQDMENCFLQSKNLQLHS